MPPGIRIGKKARLAFMTITAKLAVSMQFSAHTPLLVKAAYTFLRCGVGDVCLPVVPVARTGRSEILQQNLTFRLE